MKEKQKLIIKCPAKSADMWRRSKFRPLVEKKPGDNTVDFIFPNNELTRKALEDHQNNVDGIRDFITMYKLLRDEMYLTIRQGDANGS